MFAEEKPALLPLPLEPFRYYQYGERTVHLDGCVEVEAAYYSAPPGWIGRRVHVQWDGARCRLLDPRTGQLLREHLRQQRGRHRIKDEDRPKTTPLGTVQLLARWKRRARTSVRSREPCIAIRAKPRCAAFWACSRSPRSTASPASTMPAPRPWKCRLTTIISCAAIWSAVRNRRSVCGKSIR